MTDEPTKTRADLKAHKTALRAGQLLPTDERKVLEAQIARLKSELEVCEASTDEGLQARVDELTSEVQALTGQIAELQRIDADKTETIERLEKTIAELEAKIASA